MHDYWQGYSEKKMKDIKCKEILTLLKVYNPDISDRNIHHQEIMIIQKIH